MIENENLITRINYDPRIKYGFAALIFASVGLALRSVDGKNSTAHIFLVPFLASVREVMVGDKDLLGDVAFGAGGSVLVEAAQAIYPLLGQAQFEDLGLDAAGIAVWLAFEKTAQKLHDSGLTDPAYKLLGINKRRQEGKDLRITGASVTISSND